MSFLARIIHIIGFEFFSIVIFTPFAMFILTLTTKPYIIKNVVSNIDIKHKEIVNLVIIFFSNSHTVISETIKGKETSSFEKMI